MFRPGISILGLLAIIGFTLVEVHSFAEAPAGATAGFAKRRMWSDKTGKFKIEAKLVNAEKKSVQIEKDDGREVTIPIENLSEPDRAFVEAFLDAAEASGGDGNESPDNPFAGGEMKSGSKPRTPNKASEDEEESPEKNKVSDNIPFVKMKTNKVKPLAISYEMNLWKAGQVAPFKLPPADNEVVKLPISKKFFDGLSMAVGGVKRTAVVSVYNIAKMQKEKFSRLGCINILDTDPVVIGAWEDPWKLYAISPDAKLFAAVSVSTFEKGNELAVFEMGADGKYAPLMHFTAGGGDWDEVLWAGFLSAKRLVTISQKSNLTIWDLEANRSTHLGNTGGVHTAAIGGRGELIALPSNKGIAFLSGDDGKQVGVIPVTSSFTPAIGFSPDGTSIAVYTPFNVSIFGLKDGKLMQSIWVNESTPNGSVHWLGSHVLLNQKLLIDATRGIPIWTYNLRNPQATSVFGDQLFTLFAGEQGGTLAAYNLPHITVEDLSEDLSPEKFYCIRPGSSFRLNSRWGGLTPDEQRNCEAAVASQLESLGWIKSADGENEVLLTLEQGPPEQGDYYSSDGRFGPIGLGFGRPSGPSTKVTERPWKHSIVISHNGEEVFKSGLVVGLPGNVQLKEGETTPQAVQRMMKPSPDFFKNTKYPKQILKPEYQGGFGSSEITESGLK